MAMMMMTMTYLARPIVRPLIEPKRLPPRSLSLVLVPEAPDFVLLCLRLSSSFLKNLVSSDYFLLLNTPRISKTKKAGPQSSAPIYTLIL